MRSGWLLIVLALVVAGPLSSVAQGTSSQVDTLIMGGPDPAFKTIQFGSVSPLTPVAGQPAQLAFRMLIAGQRGNGSLDTNLRPLLKRRLTLRIADQLIPMTGDALSSEQSDVTSTEGAVTVQVNVTITFVWPDSLDDAGLFGLGRTVTQIVILSDSAGEAASSTPVKVIVPTSRTFYIFVAQGALVAASLAVSLLFLAYRRKRTWEAEEQETLRQKEEYLRSQEEAIKALNSAEPSAERTALAPADLAKVNGLESHSSYDAVPSIDHIELPDALVAAVAAGQVVLVVGDGVSAQAGLPTGSSLLLHILQGLGEKYVPRSFKRIVNATNPEALLNDVVDKFGGISRAMDTLISSASREQVAALIAEAVRNAPPSSPLHQALAQFPWRAVVDLTWDGMAERSFVEHLPPDAPHFIIVTMGEAAGLTKALRGGERLLLKPFGYLDQPSRLVLTTEDLRRNFNRSPEFLRTLSGLLQSQTFLFVGVNTDLQEQLFNIAGFDYEATEARHFALLPSDPINEFRAESLSRFGVKVLPFDPKASGLQLSQFFKDMQRAVRRSGQIVSGTGHRYMLSPERVTRLRLESIGPFDSLDLVLYDRKADDEFQGNSPWSVIFGGNGVGKSSILRALSLVLAGDAPAALDAGRRLLRAGASQGLIEVQVGEQVLRTRLVRDRATVIVTSSQPTPVQTGNALVLGFPALRGARSSEPSGPSAMAEVSDPDPADLVALISGDVDNRLGDFKQWLVNILVQADKGSERAHGMRTLLDAIISDMVPGQIHALAPLAKDDFVIRVVTPEGVIPFDDLSQGMASIFNWVGLLVQRLFTICDRSEQPQHEPAIVIIDEIDAHLHPEWQRRLVTLTRRHFPQLQVIATSHSPLLAGALRRHEMAVLERNIETNRVERLIGVGETYGLPSQDIMTSPVFGMSTDRNPAVERLIHDYFQIFEKPYRSAEEEVELVRLHGALREFRYAQPIEVTPLDLSEDAIADLSVRLGAVKK